jgi:hypothetical protein
VDTQQAVTIAIKPCRSCGGGVPETDRFCRLCGESQSAPQAPVVEAAPDLREASRNTDLEYAGGSGAVLSRPGASGAMEPQFSYHLVSGPVVWALSAPAGGVVKGYGPRIMRIVSLLISVPVWLIILLLSPLDAYAAARIITEARWQREHS